MIICRKAISLIGLLMLLVSPMLAQEVEEVRRYEAPNATQAVAVNDSFFFTISNSKIIKRRKSDGKEVANWSGGLKHLNSGIIINGKLYCANTNYPQIPMASSLEIFDVQTLEHIGTHSFGIFLGSFTWIDQLDSDWYLMFVHYENYAQERDKGVAYTTMIQTDSLFRRMSGWTLPKKLTDYLKPTSISGGLFLNENTLIFSPHHFEEIYTFSIPKMGHELVWEKTIKVPFQGQGIALDKSDGSIWGIHRKKREVIQIRIN